MSPPVHIPPDFTECASDPATTAGAEPGRRLERLQELIDKIEALPNPPARALLQECLQSVLSFYGQGLAHILQSVEESGPGGAGILEGWCRDKAVSAMLLIHGLHPRRLEERLRHALETVRPYLQNHGGNVELISLVNDFARLRLHGTGKGCPGPTATLESALRAALEEWCPDLAGFAVEAPPAAAVPPGTPTTVTGPGDERANNP